MPMYDTKQMGMRGLGGGGAPAASAPPPAPDASVPSAGVGDARAKLMAMPQDQLVDIMIQTFPPDVLNQALAALEPGPAPVPDASVPPTGGGMGMGGM